MLPPRPARPPQRTSYIGNKQKRSDVYGKLKHKQKVTKKKERLRREQEDERCRELGEEPAPRAVPATIESKREADVTGAPPLLPLINAKAGTPSQNQRP